MTQNDNVDTHLVHIGSVYDGMPSRYMNPNVTVPEKTLPKSQNTKIEFNINMARGRIMEYNGENHEFISRIAEKLRIFKHFNLE